MSAPSSTTTGRKGLGIPPVTQGSPTAAQEKEKAPRDQQQPQEAPKFKLPSLRFSPTRRRR